MLQEFLINTAIPWLIAWMQSNPNIAPVILVLVTIQGICRMWLKPIMTAIIQFTNLTESPKDNEFVDKILSSKIYKILAFVIDWIISVKLPQVTKAEVKNEIPSNDPIKLADDINKLPSQK